MKNSITLNNGASVPSIGLGTWKSKPQEVGQAVEYALTKAGYKHIDCASIYGNENEIGEAFTNAFTEVKRDEVFVTSKLWNTDHKAEDVEKACKKTLADLQLEYLDLYLMHWGIAFSNDGDLEPIGKDGKAITIPISIQETWHAMEELVQKGLVKSIGVANFTTMMLVDLLTYAKIQPVMNQIQIHPYNTQSDLIDFCRYKNIAVTAYSPLAHEGPTLFEETVVASLAKKYQKTPSQILLNWSMQRETIAIPKSVTPEKISENIDIFDFEVTEEEIEEITSLNKNKRFVNPVEWWNIPYFS